MRVRPSRRTTATAAAAGAIAVGALLAAPAAHAGPAASPDQPTVDVSGPSATITAGKPETYTVHVTNPTDTALTHARVDLAFGRGEGISPAVAGTDLTLSVTADDGAKHTATVEPTGAGAPRVVSAYLDEAGGRTFAPGADVTYTVTATFDDAWRSYVNIDADLDTFDADGTSNGGYTGQGFSAFVPRATPYPHPQTVVLDRPGASSLFYATADTNGGGQPVQVRVGTPSDIRLTTDEFGNGASAPFVYDPAQSLFGAADSAETTGQSRVLTASAPGGDHFGSHGDTPLSVGYVGQADGVTTGLDVDGVYRPSTATFYLRRVVEGSLVTTPTTFGSHGDTPLVGNWDGSAQGDEIGVYRPSTRTFYLRLADGSVLTARYGSGGDTPVVGDWDGTGKTLIGVRRGNVFYLATSNTAPTSRAPFAFGSASDRVTTSAWAETAQDLLATAVSR